jgi:hypothetical protein
MKFREYLKEQRNSKVLLKQFESDVDEDVISLPLDQRGYDLEVELANIVNYNDFEYDPGGGSKENIKDIETAVKNFIKKHKIKKFDMKEFWNNVQ